MTLFKILFEYHYEGPVQTEDKSIIEWPSIYRIQSREIKY
jgi:hypothetical protein